MSSPKHMTRDGLTIAAQEYIAALGLQTEPQPNSAWHTGYSYDHSPEVAVKLVNDQGGIVCFNKAYDRLAALAKENGWTIPQESRIEAPYNTCDARFSFPDGRSLLLVQVRSQLIIVVRSTDESF